MRRAANIRQNALRSYARGCDTVSSFGVTILRGNRVRWSSKSDLQLISVAKKRAAEKPPFVILDA
jgi:hypothetical protein